MALGIGVGLVLDTVFFERRHREFEVQEGRPDVAVPVLDENRRGDVFEAGEGLGLVVDLGPLFGESAVAVRTVPAVPHPAEGNPGEPDIK